MTKKILGVALVSLGLHLTLGWMWTVVAGFLGGVWAAPRGWFVGALGVGLAWLMLVGFNFLVAAGPMSLLISALGSLIGNTLPALIVGATLFMGLLIGALGGWVGDALVAVFGGEAAASAVRPASGS